MKKTIQATAVLVSVFLSGAASAAGSVPTFKGAGGNVEFTGEIVDSSCNVTSTSKNLHVDLGHWAKSYFTSVGDETTKKPFSINVDNCPASVTSVAVLFDGQKDKTDPTLLEVAAGSAGGTAATGVAIKLYNASNASQIQLGQLSEAVAPVSAKAQLDFLADYRATTTRVTAGPANATATFLMVYN